MIYLCIRINVKDFDTNYKYYQRRTCELRSFSVYIDNV